MDRGMVSEKNIARLQRSKASYIVGTPKAMLRQFERQLTDHQDWRTVQEGLEVKRVGGPEGNEVFILARSADRKAKEQAMHQRFLLRLEDGLRKLEVAAGTGHLKDEGLANRRLGRLLQKNWRVAGAFQICVERLLKPEGKARLRITWQRDDNWSAWAGVSEGCYILRSNLCDLDPTTLWKRYIQLTEAEWAFRIDKDELAIRPIWHQTEHRVLAHILVCFLAYVMWKTLAGWMQRSRLGDAPRTLLEEFGKIQSGDVVLQARTDQGDPSRQIRLRCVVEPDGAQKALLSRLGLALPRRLRRIDEQPGTKAEDHGRPHPAFAPLP
jgi:transposase